jgi:hypothetical protein
MKKNVFLYVIFVVTVMFAFVQGQEQEQEQESTTYTLFYNDVSQQFHGPLVGFYNRARGNHKSVQVGYVNLNTQNLDGIQVGFTNLVSEDLVGLQTGFVNRAATLHGLQTGYVNISSGQARGLQTGFVNMTKEFNGAQTGFVNKATTLYGLQAGYVNISTDQAQGAQIGFVNSTTKTVKGVQIGFINIADRIESGIPFGFLSIVRNGGYMAVEYGFSNIYPLNLSLKSGVEKFYTSINLAWNPASIYTDKCLAAGAGIGSIVFVNESFFFNPEIIYLHMFALHKEYYTSNDFNVLFGYQIGNNFGIVGGPFVGRKQIYDDGDSQSPLFNILDYAFDKKNSIYLGVRIGVRFRF